MVLATACVENSDRSLAKNSDATCTPDSGLLTTTILISHIMNGSASCCETAKDPLHSTASQEKASTSAHTRDKTFMRPARHPSRHVRCNDFTPLAMSVTVGSRLRTLMKAWLLNSSTANAHTILETAWGAKVSSPRDTASSAMRSHRRRFGSERVAIAQAVLLISWLCHVAVGHCERSHHICLSGLAI